jgi:activator of HSP90 ATPase
MPFDIKFKVKYRVPVHIIYEALTDENLIFKYTQTKTTYPNKEGELFSLYDNAINGKIKELKKDSKIIQTWKFSNWKSEAELRLIFKPKKGNESEITVELKGVPDRDMFDKTIEEENIKAGFMMQIFDNISKWIGYPQNKDESDSEDDD